MSFWPKLNSNDEKIDYLLQSKPLIKSKILWHKIKPQKDHCILSPWFSEEK